MFVSPFFVQVLQAGVRFHYNITAIVTDEKKTLFNVVLQCTFMDKHQCL